MKKVLAFALSLLILVSTVWVGFTGITVVAEENTSTVDLNDASKWVPNPNKASMAVTAVTEDDFSALQASAADYQSMYVEVELKVSTNYAFLFDFKSSLKIENIQIWPTKCNPVSSSDGSVTYDKENYTTADRILFTGGYDGTTNFSSKMGHADPTVWYDGNALSFTTNATDTSYRIFFKFNGNVNKDVSTAKTFTFKNAYVKEKNTAAAVAKGNGIATVSKEVGYVGDAVTYTATANEGEEFFGWYNGDTLITTEPTYETTLSSGENTLAARFTTNNLMNLALWSESPGRPAITITEAVEDTYNTIKVYDVPYAYVAIDLELKSAATYEINFDIKTAYKLENIQIWPAKCGCTANSQGNVTCNENYTTADRLYNAYPSKYTDNSAWIEDSIIEITTNEADASYQLFLKFGGVIDAATNATKSTFFKNFTVKEKVTASATPLGNGSATVSKTEGLYGDAVTYTATANDGEEFLGWYNGDLLASTDAIYNTTLASGTNALTAKFTTNNLMNVACWGESPSRASIQITEATVDGFDTIKVYDIQYAYFYVNMELKPNTAYKLSYDYQTDYKPEYVDIWATKCGAKPKSDGNVGAGDGYTDDDKLLRKYLSSTNLDNTVWYENNTLEFTTNATDTSYQFFMKFGGFVNEDAKTTKSVYFKNFKIGEPVTASASAFGNGTATVSLTDGAVGDIVTYTATPNAGESFVGWYNGSYELVSKLAEYSAPLISGSNDLTAYFTTNDNMNIASWHANPKRSDMRINKISENDVDVISASSIYYNLYYFDVLLEPDTEYTFAYDFKSALKFENVQVWPLKCNPHAADNGTVTFDKENYTDADKVLFKGGYDGITNLSSMLGHTSYNTWYEGNRIAFTTNATDSAYRVFFKMNGWVDSNTENQTTNAAYFKNVSVQKSYNQTVDFEIIGEDVDGNILSDSSEFSTAETIKTENEDGTVTAKVIYTVDEANMVIFKGWYEGDIFRSGSEAYTFNSAEVNADNLVAKFVSRNLLEGAGSFENHGAEKSLRVSPAGAGVLPEGEKWGMWSKWPTNSEVAGGYECESTNGSMVVTSGTQIGIKYLSSLDWVDETEQYISETATTTLDPLDGNKMLRISAPFRSAIRKIDNLKPNTNYTLSFYVWNPDRWNCMRTAVITDTLELETYVVKTGSCKVYDYYSGMNPAKFLNDTGLDAEYPVREWQKITFNFTTDEDDEYLYLHLGLSRKDVASNSGYIYIDNLICYENVFETVGNAIRAGDSALRFKYSVKNELLTDYYEGSAMDKIGLIATPTDAIDGAVEVDGNYTLKDVAESNYQYVDGDNESTYFTAALYNIGRIDGRMDYNRYAKDYTVRPYIVYTREDGTEFILYGDVVTANIFDVMYTIKLNAENKSDMEIVDAMLENEQLYEVYQNYQDKDYFYIDKSNATNYAYSMAVVGDIQTTNYYYRDKLHYLYDWIIDNAEDKNIQYVFGLGDITDMSTDEEFIAAKEQLLRIKEAGIDQTIIRGNHDWGYDNYITYEDFGDGLVSYDGTMRSYYRLTTIGGIKYMMLTLDLFPNDDIVNWADEVIAAHPDYNVIITTHGYFDGGMTIGDGNLLQDEDIQWVDDPTNANSGQDMFDKLVNKHSNIVLLMCGHEIPEDHGPSYEVTTREDGSKVVQMMVNHQHLEYYGNCSYGMLAMLYFSEDGKNVQLEYFSTINEMYYMDKFQQEFELDLID